MVPFIIVLILLRKCRIYFVENIVGTWRRSFICKWSKNELKVKIPSIYKKRKSTYGMGMGYSYILPPRGRMPTIMVPKL
jgi:hypothetical protein